MTYVGIVQMLLETYVTDDILSEAHASVSEYKKPDQVPPIVYAERLSDKAEKTGDVFPEESLKEVFLKVHPQSYRGYVPGNLTSNPTLSLAELARFASNVSVMKRANTTTSKTTMNARTQATSSTPSTDSKKPGGKRGYQDSASRSNVGYNSAAKSLPQSHRHLRLRQWI